ncbi:MAG: tetratricopeptide repeat protein [Planctomycetaceae bacterium]|nr:tetratricopeptide repeat protein [Planctomycetaceae bacterium]
MNYFTCFSLFLRIIGQGILGVTVLAAPWCYGSVESWPQPWLFTGILAGLLLGGLTQLLTPTRQNLTITIILPILLIIGFVKLQLLPLSPETLRTLSPRAMELREQLLPARDSEEYRLLQTALPEFPGHFHAAMSIYPAATRHLLALFLLVTGTFTAGILLFTSRKSVQIIVTLVAINGMALALLGMILRLVNVKSGFLYTNTFAAYSSFLSKNTAAGYLCICLGATVAALLWSYFSSENYKTYQYLREVGDTDDTLFQRFTNRLSTMLSGTVLTWLLFLGILAAGILVSYSRGGVIAMIFSLLIGLGLLGLTQHNKMPLVILLVILLGGAGLITWGGLSGSVMDRLSTLLEEDTFVKEARPTNWKNAFQTIHDYQGRGSGFGTYQYAVLPHDETAAKKLIFVHAENQYVEILTDLGYAGFCLFLAMIVMACVAVSLFLRSPAEWNMALGTGILVVITGQLVASLADFGLYIPSNAMLLAFMTALLGVSSSENTAAARPLLSRGITAGCSLIFFGLLFWGRSEIVKVDRIERITREAEALGTPQTVEPAKLQDVAQRLESAVRQRPDSAAALMRLAELKIALFRRAAYDELKTLPAHANSEEKAVWAMTSLEHLHNQICLWKSLNFKVPLRQLQSSPIVKEHLVPAFPILLQARNACPLIPRSHLLLAELAPLTDTQNQLHDFEEVCIKRVTICSPYSSAMLYSCGVLEKNLRNWDRAYEYWKRSLELSPTYLTPVTAEIKLRINEKNASEIFEKVFPNTPKINYALYTNHFSPAYSPFLFEIAASRDEALLLARPELLNEGEKHAQLGHLYFLRKDYTKSVREFQEALRYQSDNHRWLYLLALAFYHLEQYQESEQAIRQAVMHKPANQTYRNFVKQIQKQIENQRKKEELLFR